MAQIKPMIAVNENNSEIGPPINSGVKRKNTSKYKYDQKPFLKGCQISPKVFSSLIGFHKNPLRYKTPQLTTREPEPNQRRLPVASGILSKARPLTDPILVQCPIK